jgi:sulfatase maturation enzyme AslB (radical SAM superfamily)
MEQLTPEDYPNLKFQIMTNGMLFTPAQWQKFPALHWRVDTLKISIDAASGTTHEALRRGARWPVMLENLRFAGDLTAQGHVDDYTLVFVVQAENFREMGDAVDLAERVGATHIAFARLTNWGTFSANEYREKAVFLTDHPQHGEFLEAMRDPRLRQPIVMPGDLQPFLDRSVAADRLIQQD